MMLCTSDSFCNFRHTGGEVERVEANSSTLLYDGDQIGLSQHDTAKRHCTFHCVSPIALSTGTSTCTVINISSHQPHQRELFTHESHPVEMCTDEGNLTNNQTESAKRKRSQSFTEVWGPKQEKQTQILPQQPQQTLPQQQQPPRLPQQQQPQPLAETKPKPEPLPQQPPRLPQQQQPQPLAETKPEPLPEHSTTLAAEVTKAPKFQVQQPKRGVGLPSIRVSTAAPATAPSNFWQVDPSAVTMEPNMTAPVYYKDRPLAGNDLVSAEALELPTTNGKHECATWPRPEVMVGQGEGWTVP